MEQEKKTFDVSSIAHFKVNSPLLQLYIAQSVLNFDYTYVVIYIIGGKYMYTSILHIITHY
jgi:hypothetical protein